MPPKITPGSFSNLVGLPYERVNCWDLVVLFYRQIFKYELAPYYEDGKTDPNTVQGLVNIARTDFERVTEPQFGDIILMKMMGVESHIGVYISSEKFLHTQTKTGSCLDSLAKWQKIVVGYYRPKEAMRHD